MREEEKNPNSFVGFWSKKSPNFSINFPDDLLDEIFLRLSLKSILKCRTISKQWRSILESKEFLERRTSRLQNNRKILAASHCDCGGRQSLLPESKFHGEEEIVYLHCDATKPSMTCEGLVCFPEQDWINVLNPSTTQLWRIPSGLKPICFSPRSSVIGFGKDKVTESYKVATMCYYISQPRTLVISCGILDLVTREWTKLSRPPRVVYPGSKSVCVDGSVYWLNLRKYARILALDLHNEKFRLVPLPPFSTTRATQIMNLEDRLTIANESEWKLEIWNMDTVEETWSKTYSISLAGRVVSTQRLNRWFTPVAVSKQGNVVFHDNQKRLFKYYPGTDEIHCLSLDICVISSYLENSVSLPLKPSHPHPQQVISDSRCPLFKREASSWISKFLERNESRILDIMFVSIVVAGYIFLPH